MVESRRPWEWRAGTGLSRLASAYPKVLAPTQVTHMELSRAATGKLPGIA